MLVDTLLHRSLFFSKNMYGKRVYEEHQHAFADVIIKDHTSARAAQNFVDIWVNHATFSKANGMPFAYYDGHMTRITRMFYACEFLGPLTYLCN
jgi:hypothetical protein